MNPAQEAFSKAALHYDQFAELHRDCANRIVEQVQNEKEFSAICDIGMGTGYLTKKLEEAFPSAFVVGIDYAKGMIECAKSRNRHFRIVEMDAKEFSFKANTFDLIVSNLAYQWITDLSQALSFTYQTLSDDGKLLLTMSGKRTFKELFESFNVNGHIERLADQSMIEGFMNKAGFENIRVDVEERNLTFMNMKDLMQWIKRIGANRLSRNVFIGKEMFCRASEYYEKHFSNHNGITATFEVIWIQAEK